MQINRQWSRRRETASSCSTLADSESGPATTVIVQPHAGAENGGVPRATYFVLRRRRRSPPPVGNATAPAAAATEGPHWAAGSGEQVTDEDLAPLERQFAERGVRLSLSQRAELRRALVQARKLSLPQPQQQQVNPQQQQQLGGWGDGNSESAPPPPSLLDGLPVARACDPSDNGEEDGEGGAGPHHALLLEGQALDGRNLPLVVLPATVDPNALLLAEGANGEGSESPAAPTTRRGRVLAWLRRHGPAAGKVALVVALLAGCAAVCVVFPFAGILLLVGVGGVLCAGGTAAAIVESNRR